MACSGKLISLLMCNHQHPLLWGRFVWWSEHINRGNETNATQNMSGMQGVYSSFYCSHLYVSLHTDGNTAPRLIQTNRNLWKLYVLQAVFAPFLFAAFVLRNVAMMKLTHILPTQKKPSQTVVTPHIHPPHSFSCCFPTLRQTPCSGGKSCP